MLSSRSPALFSSSLPLPPLCKKGIPVLFYGEHAWEHPKGAFGTWSANRNMRVIISGNVWEHAEAVSGIDYAVCYLDPKRGTFSNASWRAWFASDPATILDGSAHSTITFFGPWMSFPSGVYRLEFFGPRMDEQGDKVKEAE
jgi:hypothetical protein